MRLTDWTVSPLSPILGSRVEGRACLLRGGMSRLRPVAQAGAVIGFAMFAAMPSQAFVAFRFWLKLRA